MWHQWIKVQMLSAEQSTMDALGSLCQMLQEYLPRSNKRHNAVLYVLWCDFCTQYCTDKNYFPFRIAFVTLWDSDHSVMYVSLCDHDSYKI